MSMCVVIDLNRISTVFNPQNSESGNFKKLKNWIVQGPGFIIFGGTRYLDELEAGPINLINNLKDYRRESVVRLKRNLVDKEQTRISNEYTECFNLENPKKDGDPHIVAICLVSKCRILCTEDRKCMNAIESIYTKNRPKFYSSDQNADLIRSENIVRIPKNVFE